MELKPFASLGATLLARKGGAKPAMRPQLAAIDGMGGEQAARTIADDLEDLGWNDMGQDDDLPHQSQVLPLTLRPPTRRPKPRPRPTTRSPAPNWPRSTRRSRR